MKTAIISDIHSNLEALEAVLRDAEANNVDKIYCLGDIVGYGPNPLECIDLVMETCEIVVLGNFELALLSSPDWFPKSAAETILWNQQLLNVGSKRRREFLARLPRRYFLPVCLGDIRNVNCNLCTVPREVRCMNSYFLRTPRTRNGWRGFFVLSRNTAFTDKRTFLGSLQKTVIP